MNTFFNLPLKTLVVAFSITFLFTSCRDNDDTTSDEVMTSDEASDEIAASLTTDVTVMADDLGAIAAAIDESSRMSTARVEGSVCGISYDTTFSASYTGTYMSFENETSYAYKLICSNSIPSSLSYTFTTDGTRSTSRLSSDGTSTGAMVASGLNLNSDVYTVSGSFEREATLVQNTGSKKTFTNVSAVTLDDFEVNKSTFQIEGGTATYLLEAESSAGGSVSYSATVVFNGDNTATITLGNSDTYLVNLKTGQVTQQ